MRQYDVIIVGKGNAALCAALAAQEEGARVAVLEAATDYESGGNSRFAGGAMRIAYNDVNDLRRLLEISDEEAENTDWDTNTVDEFFDDMFRVTAYRCDPDLTEILIKQSLETMVWLRGKGVRFTPFYGSTSQMVDGRRRFFGRNPVAVSGGGEGLVQALDEAARKAGIDVFFETRVTGLVYDGVKVSGVRTLQKGQPLEFHAGAVVLACGGFEANAEMRTKYLGPGWELAKVRGTRYNMGEGLKMALDIGACPHGNWSGRHTTPWDRNSPEFGDVTLMNSWYRHSYPLSVMINAQGKRFVDEGADFYNYTYAIYGEIILQQPGQFAWQIFDGKSKKYVRSEYQDKRATRVVADTLEELAGKLEGVDPEQFLKTMHEYNAAVKRGVAYNPAIKDGACTEGLALPKTNWAVAYDTAPFEAYNTTCGITFTFGGLRVEPSSSQVLDVTMRPIPGLYTAGEMLGGLYYFNYGSGTGLVSGSVFGKIAGGVEPGDRPHGHV
ncbi:MAG: FAD-dependent oxidoreductase, partial [Comamonadaceae bacterium]